MTEGEHDASNKDASPSKKSDKVDKAPIDNASLAFMLRASADLVEKGEFDVILYHALQDFRTYYKQHLPKKKDKKKKTKVVSTTTTHIPADPPTETQPVVETPVKRPEPESLKVEPSPSVPEPSTASVATDAAISDDPPKEILPPEPSPDKPITSESARFDSNASYLDSSGSMEAFSNEASLRQIPEPETSPMTTEKPASTNKLTAGMFAKKMKLPKKLPKIHMQLPNSAKKHKGKAEISELTGGEFAQQAESSKRRNGPVDANFCKIHQTMNCPCKQLQPAFTGFSSATASTVDSVTTPTPEIPVDRASGNSPTRSEPALTEEAPETAVLNNAEAAPLPADKAFPSSLSEAFVADPSPGAFDSFEIPTMDYSNAKPSFQKPKNKTSSLVANGWIEQQRRSKMRTVWKEVLASLVEGKRPGEETTLWIQREVTDPTTGKKELEALHQIPVKLLESVIYSEYTTDDRFSLKLFKAQEEFVFRCNADPSAAMNWVMTLQQYEIAARNNAPVPDFAKPPSQKSSFEDEKKGPDPVSAPQPESTTRLAIRDLRAICHGAGINTAGMERTELERAAAEVNKRGTYFAPPNMAPGGTAPPTARSASPAPAPPVQPTPGPTKETTSSATPQKVSIKDLRAICHGSGISTVGMERGELEAAAEEVRKRGTYFNAPSTASTTSERTPDDAWMEGMKKKEDLAAQQEAMRRYEEARRKQAAEEEARRRQAEEELRRRAEDETRRRQAEEEHRRRMAEEEHRRRMAEQQAVDQRRRYAEQQAAWQRDEEQRRRAEQHAAEQRRRHEEAVRQQQQWAKQQQPQQQQPQQKQTWTRHPPQPHGHPSQQHQQQWNQQQHGHPGQQPQWQQQQWQQHQQFQQQQQQGRPQAPPQQQHAPPPQQQVRTKSETFHDIIALQIFLQLFSFAFITAIKICENG